ncbi:MAG: ABC transporter permease [Acutalibacteraceae bacterium]|nr:ABC transporter permease [Acutalibacteraceae bacterium]
MFNNIKYVWNKYNFLLRQLVSRDFKVKYKRSVLGVFWSLLYPVLTMAVMALVFTNVFKFTTPGVSYLAYLMSGLVIFNYFSEATNLSMSSVVANFSLINKVYMPKYIFPVSKCIFVGINFLLSQIPLYVILIATGTGVNWYHFVLPFGYFCLFMFTLGFSMILATVAVFLRDMFYIYGVIISLWTYMTPIMYDIAIIENPLLRIIFKCNPMYWFVYFTRRIMLYNTIPEINVWIYCFAFGFGFLIIGILVFKKNQDKFIYYV